MHHQPTTDWIDRRRAAVLLHITSLPGPQPVGVLGEEARHFIDRALDGGFTIWQFLPIGPTHDHGSPYESLSSFAGNPELIDLRPLVQRGWLSSELYRAVVDGVGSAESARAEASARFWQQAEHDGELAGAMRHFRDEHEEWLEDYALFAALKKTQSGQPWWRWPESLRRRDPLALSAARQLHVGTIRQTLFEQWVFDGQWQSLKHYAEERGMHLFGDIPIYVAHDSADVWSNQKLFNLNELGECIEVAGVPPDYFSETGQRWGNPLYQWESMKKSGFEWWVTRVKHQLSRMHLVRIDHFRGFEAYWAIPGERMDGRIGEWRPAPGAKLLETIRLHLGELPLVAEDLGLITPEVLALRDRFHLPGMKILHFAFGDDARNPYLPHNHTPDSVVYTGTHDNDTTLGWYTAQDDYLRQRIAHYCGCRSECTHEGMPWPMIRMALASVSKLAVIPAQDLLELGSEARFNTPGTVNNNWKWRMHALDELTSNLTRVREMNLLYGRC